MELKVGDFGLATRVEYVGERKRTVCGTPNYIAPEILEGKNGHSYEVDIWSIGVIIYTLIIGKPPFETSDVKTTYKKIKSLSYDFPQNVPVSNLCKDIITKILQLDPIKRPKIQDLLVDPFINPNEYTPPLLMPQSTLACPPSKSFLTQILIAESNKSPSTSRADKENGKDSLPDKNKTSSVSNTMLVEQVQSKSNDSFKTLFTNAHYIHVDTYIDYSNKYGIGYLLTNKSYGVMFSDSTKIIQEHKCSTFVYYDRIKQSSTVEPKYQYSISTHPAFLDKKVKIFLKFKESLKVPNAEEEQPTSDDPIHLKNWIKTANAFMFRTSNSVFQVVFTDLSQIIIFPAISKLYYLSKKKEGSMYALKEALNSKIPELSKRVKYAKEIVTQTFNKPKSPVK